MTVLGATSRACAEALEGVYLGLRDQPEVDRKPVAAALDGALSALARGASSPLHDPAHVSHLEAAVEAVRRVEEALADAGPGGQGLLRAVAGAGAALRQCRAQVIEEVVAAQGEPAANAGAPESLPAFRASVGLPRLHRAPPQPFAPLVDLGLDDADEEDISGNQSHESASAAVVATGDAGAEDVGLTEAAALRRMARDCLDEIATLGNLCRAGSMDPWSTNVPAFEQRLLDNLDALLSLSRDDGAAFHLGSASAGAAFRLGSASAGAPAGVAVPCVDVVREAQALAADSPAVEADRAFARALTLGCLDGEEPMRAAVLSLRQADARTLDRQRDALVRGSSPAIAPAMRALCASSPPDLTRLALDVLRLRGEARFEDAALLLSHPRAGVREAAARCLGAVQERAPASALLQRSLRDDGAPAVAAAAATGLAVLGAPEGLWAARAMLERGGLPAEVRAELLGLLAAAGHAADAAALCGALTDGATTEALALGWCGRPEAVEPLLLALEASAGGALPTVMSPEVLAQELPFAVAVADAVHRITGLGRPAVAAAREPGGLAELIDAAALRARWAEARGDLPRGVKLRFGQAWTPAASLDELEARGVRAADRALCALEVAIASKGTTLIRLGTWTARQKADIAVARKAFPPGRTQG